MIPHHINAVQMSKLFLKQAPSEIAAVEGLEDIIWDSINVQNYQIHQFRADLGSHENFSTILQDGDSLNADSVGHYCTSTLDVDVNIVGAVGASTPSESVLGCAASDTTLCVK